LTDFVVDVFNIARTEGAFRLFILKTGSFAWSAFFLWSWSVKFNRRRIWLRKTKQKQNKRLRLANFHPTPAKYVIFISFFPSEFTVVLNFKNSKTFYPQIVLNTLQSTFLLISFFIPSSCRLLSEKMVTSITFLKDYKFWYFRSLPTTEGYLNLTNSTPCYSATNPNFRRFCLLPF
jgi:hypothetical protein